MSFLAPLFFIGLAALAIPVLLHLIQREKKQILHFPSLMFVRQIPYKSVRRRRIHNWFLLFLRLAALALIVAAFARPFLSSSTTLGAGAAGAREVVILLDQSYSLGYGDRWQRAQAAASDVVDGLGPQDRGSLVVFSTGADILLRSAVDAEPLRAAVESASLSDGATRYAPALKVAGGILAESPLPRREVVLISDFQQSGWRGGEGVQLPAGAELTAVPITSDPEPNASVTAVSLGRSTFSEQERVAVTAAIVNRGDRSLQGATISLEVGGRVLQSQRLDVEAAGTASATFDPFTVDAVNVRGTVRIDADALGADNAFNFVVSPREPLRAVVVDREASQLSVHLAQALAIGDAPRIEPIVRQPNTITDADLESAAVVVLNDVVVPAALGRRLTRFVENGGGLFVALGPRATWPAEADLLPGALLQPVDRSRGDSGRIGGLEYGHPIFEPFRAPRSGDFTTVRFYGYRSVTPTESAQVLARFDAGAPALLDRRVGSGRVVLFASTLDLSWTDLPLKPVYLPFVHQAVRYLASYTEEPAWLSVGQVLDSSAGAARNADLSDRVVLTPSGSRVSLGEDAAEVLGLTEAGFYEVRQGRGEVELAVFASNVDPLEADLSPMDPQEIVVATAGPEGAGGGEGAAIPLTPEARERSQRLWWYLLVFGLLLLGAETLVSNRLSKA